MTSSKTTIGVASTARVPSARSRSTSPSAGSWISVRGLDVRDADGAPLAQRPRLSAGSRGASSPTGVDAGRVPLGQHRHAPRRYSPRRMKARLTPIARPSSSTATRSTASRSSSERTRRPMPATSRSRASASSSAVAERTRSSASAVSAASAERSASSSRRSSGRAARSPRRAPPRPRLSATTGTNTALFAPHLLGEARVDQGRALDVVDGDRCARRARPRRSPTARCRGGRASTATIPRSPARPRATSPRRPPRALVDERDRGEVGADRGEDGVDEQPRGRLVGVARRRRGSPRAARRRRARGRPRRCGAACARRATCRSRSHSISRTIASAAARRSAPTRGARRRAARVGNGVSERSTQP